MEQELWILLRLLIACVFGGLIGFERGESGKAAGLRTHMLIALGAALFVSFTELFTIATDQLAPPGPAGNFRIQIEPLATIEAVVTGISFIGAGLIFVSTRRAKVQNLTTAASIWVTAAIGIAVGVERYLLATGATMLALVILRLLPSAESYAEPDAAEGEVDGRRSALSGR